jgi:hypothetical protein
MNIYDNKCYSILKDARRDKTDTELILFWYILGDGFIFNNKKGNNILEPKERA